LSEVVFNNCKFDNNIFKNAFLDVVKFNGCVLKNANFKNAYISVDAHASSFLRCDFSNATIGDFNKREYEHDNRKTIIEECSFHNTELYPEAYDSMLECYPNLKNENTIIAKRIHTKQEDDGKEENKVVETKGSEPIQPVDYKRIVFGG
jgi:uncharacterized protein YjbI with pentapeptide repeats